MASAAQQHIGRPPLGSCIFSFLCALFQLSVCSLTLPLITRVVRTAGPLAGSSSNPTACFTQLVNLQPAICSAGCKHPAASGSCASAKRQRPCSVSSTVAVTYETWYRPLCVLKPCLCCMLPQESQCHGADGWRVLDSLAASATGSIITRKAIKPSETEVAANPRSRSAKLRVFQRAGGPTEVQPSSSRGKHSNSSSSSSSSQRPR